ncbi:tetratricopeptide repeat protein [Candidatus Poribacteria bacterium]
MGKNPSFILSISHTSLPSLAICILMLSLLSYSPALSEDNSAPPTEEELYQQCKRLFSEGGFVEAGSHLERFRSLYPESKHTEEMLFMQAFLQPAIDVSIETYRLIIEKYPGGAWVAKSHFQLGQSYYLQGEYNKALDHYGKIIISYPEDETYWPARYWKCRSLMAKGDYEEAMSALRTLEGSGSGEMGKDMILMSIGNCYLGMKDYEHAADTYRSLTKSMPDSRRVPSAYLLLAKSLQYLNKLEEAKGFYRKVIESYGQSIEAQQAQQHLNSLSAPQPAFPSLESVKRKPAAPEAVKEIRTPAYFSIQVGAFSSKGNAESLARQLRKKGYTVDIIPPASGKSRLYRIWIGRYKTRAGALSAARRLGKNEKLDTKVVNQ